MAEGNEYTAHFLLNPSPRPPAEAVYKKNGVELEGARHEVMNSSHRSIYGIDAVVPTKVRIFEKDSALPNFTDKVTWDVHRPSFTPRRMSRVPLRYRVHAKVGPSGSISYMSNNGRRVDTNHRVTERRRAVLNGTSTTVPKEYAFTDPEFGPHEMRTRDIDLEIRDIRNPPDNYPSPRYQGRG